MNDPFPNYKLKLKKISEYIFLHENPHKSFILFPSHHHGRHGRQEEEEPECKN